MTPTTLKPTGIAEHEPINVKENVEAGALGGVIGGLLMAVWAVLSTYAKGLGLFAVPIWIGSTFMKPEMVQDHALAIGVWGTVLHLMISAVFGIGFAFLVRRTSDTSVALTIGALYTAVIFFVMVFVVMPYADPIMASHTAAISGTLVGMHLWFVLGIASIPALRRWLWPTP